MENKDAKRGPKDEDYVNKLQKHEVKYGSKNKKLAMKFGSGSKESEDVGSMKVNVTSINDTFERLLI